MQSKAKTVTEYIKELPEDRRADIEAVRKVILKNLPKGYEECMNYGMIGYVVPLKTYPAGYLGRKTEPLPYAALASQKNHIGVYLMNIYGDKKTETWFRKEFETGGYKLDMGKSCVRFKSADRANLPAIGKAIAKTSVKEYISMHDKTLLDRKNKGRK